MENPSIPASEQLLAHGSALRAIVRSLIGDEHADDIVQDSYLATLRRDAPVADLGSWMRGVARKLSFRRLRGEERRRRRETMAASLRETTDVQADLLSQIADEVRELREPFRTAVIMRYWQGLPPRTISSELGIPLNTVRSRLQTGLLELRDKLDNRNGSRGAWVGPLALLGTQQAATAGTGAAGLAILGGLGACGAIAALFAFASDPERVGADPTTGIVNQAQAASDARRDAPGKPVALDRSSLEAEFVDGQCVAYGSKQPLPDCRVRLITPGAKGRERGEWMACDDRGRFRVRDESNGRIEGWLEVAGKGRANVRVDLGLRQVGEIQLPLGVRITGTVRDEVGVPITGVRMRLNRRCQYLLLADSGYPAAKDWLVYKSQFDEGLTGSGNRYQPLYESFVQTDHHGEFTLSGRWLGVGKFDPDDFRIENLERCKFISLGYRDQGDTVRLDVVMRRPVELPKITGTVTTKGGKPIAGAKVVATSRDWSKVVAHTDAQGRFELIKSKGADEADHVTLTMPPVVGAGFATIDPGRSFSWGDANIRIYARSPVPLSLTTNDHDLRSFELVCTSFTDEDCAIGVQFIAQSRGATTARAATYLVARGVSHLVLRAGDKAMIYLGFHRFDKTGQQLSVVRHRVEFQTQNEKGELVSGVYLDLLANFANQSDAPFLQEACDDLLDSVLPLLRTARRGACVVEFGFAPADCAVRFSRGRKSMQLEAVPKARPVVVIVPR